MKINNKHISLFLILLIGVGMVVVCNAAGNKEVTVDPSAKEFELNINDIIVIELEENPTTGYTWNYVIENENIMKLDSDIFVKPEADAIGSGGKHIWKFKTLKKGNTKIIFQYYREWEGKENSAETQKYIIKIK